MAESLTQPYLAAAILSIMAEHEFDTLFQETDFEFHNSRLDSFVSEDEKFGSASTEEINEALNHLVGQNLVEKLDDPFTRPDYLITQKGRDYLYTCYQNPRSLEARFAKRGLVWLREALLNIHKNNHPFFSRGGGIARVTEDGSIRVLESAENDVNSDSKSEAVDLPLAGALGASQSPSASTSPEFSSTAPSEISGAVGGEPLNTYTVNGPAVPASDRYVSVRDNQASFDDLLAQLDRIKAEYQRDHNRLANAPMIGEILAETDAAIAQIKRGFVRLEQIARGLVPTYEQGCLALAAYPGMSQLMSDAVNIAQNILRFFGFL